MFGKKFLVRLFVFFKNSKKVCKNTHNVGDGEVHRFKSLSIMKRKAKRVLPTGWCGSFVMNVMGLLVLIMIYHI